MFKFDADTIAKIVNNTKTQEQWLSSSVILLAGELGIASDTLIIKIGNGIDLWEDLPSVNLDSLGNIPGINVSNIQNGQVLEYDSANEEWVNYTLPALPEDLDLSNYDNTNSNFAVVSDLSIVATSGSYDDLLFKPDLDSYSLITETGNKITLSLDNETYQLTATLKNKNDVVLSTSNIVDLPMETLVVNGRYDNSTKKIILTLFDGNEIEIPVGDLIAGIQTQLNGNGYVKVNGTTVTYDDSVYLTTTDAETTYAALAGNNVFTGTNTFNNVFTATGITGNGIDDLVLANDGNVVLRTYDNGTQIGNVRLTNDGETGSFEGYNVTIGTIASPWSAAYISNLIAETITIDGTTITLIPQKISEVFNDSGFLAATDITIINGGDEEEPTDEVMTLENGMILTDELGNAFYLDIML